MVRKSYLLLIVPVLLVCLVFFPELFMGRIILDIDYLFQQVPFRSFIHSEILSGRFPYIYPYSLSGIPLLSHGQIGIFFPITFLTLLFKNQFLAYYIELAILLIVGFLGEYIFSSLYLDSFMKRIVASLYFAFSPFVFIHIIHLNLLIPYVLLPFSLYFTANIERNGKYAIALTFIFALNFLSLHPQMVMIHVVIVLLYALFFPLRFRRIKTIVFSLITALILCAVQIIPFLLFKLTGKFSHNYGLSWMLQGSFDPFVSWVLFFVPAPYLRTRVHNTPMNGEIYLYISGILAVIAYFHSGIWKRHRQLLIMLLIGLLLMTVRYNPLYLLLSRIPLLNSTRGHIRWWGGILPFVSLMVSMGMTVIGEQKKTRRVVYTVLTIPAVWVLYFLMVKLSAPDKWFYLFNIEDRLNISAIIVFILAVLILIFKRKRNLVPVILLIEITSFASLVYYHSKKSDAFMVLKKFRFLKEKRTIGVPVDIKGLRVIFGGENANVVKNFTIFGTFFHGNFSYFLPSYNILGYTAPQLEPRYAGIIRHAIYSGFSRGENPEEACKVLKTTKAHYLVSFFPVKNASCVMPFTKINSLNVYKVVYSDSFPEIRFIDGNYVVDNPNRMAVIEVPVRYLPGLKVFSHKKMLKFVPVSDFEIRVFTEGESRIFIKYVPVWLYYGAGVSLLGFLLIITFTYFKGKSNESIYISR